MKKHLLMIVCILISMYAIAEKNPIKRHQERLNALESIKTTFSKKDQLLSSNTTVPRLTKQYNWNTGVLTWDPQSAISKVYLNDLLTKDLYLSFSLVDTFNINEYTYDNERRLIQKLNKYKISTGVYTPSFREVTVYQNNGLKKTTSFESYNSSNNTWEPQFRNTIEYNTRGDETGYVQENYINGQWKVQYGYQISYTYLNSTNNKITESIYSNYDTITNAFIPYYKDVYNYNSSEYLIEYISYEYNASTLIPSFKDSIYYTNGLPNSLIEYEYNPLNNNFELSAKLDQLTWLNFDPNIEIFDNEPTSYTFSIRENNNWIPQERSSTTFPDNNGSSIRIAEEYINNSWVYASRRNELYNSNKNLIEDSYDEYNTSNNSWKVRYGMKYTFQYNLNNIIIDEQQEYYNENSLAWEKTYRYEYSDFITIALGVNTNKNTLETKLYPNPSANGTVCIQVKLLEASVLNIKISDMKGSIVYTDESNVGKGVNTVELKNMEQGMYIVELNTEYGISRTKLVVSN